jgi:hypothetical protein
MTGKAKDFHHCPYKVMARLLATHITEILYKTNTFEVNKIFNKVTKYAGVRSGRISRGTSVKCFAPHRQSVPVAKLLKPG